MSDEGLTFRDDGVAIRNGEPWFPIGAWGLPRCNDPMRRLGDAGFNMVINGHARIPHDDRLSVIMSAGRCDRDFKEFVRIMRSKPEFLGWVISEPVWDHMPLENVKAAYQAIRDNAPELILWQCHAPQNTVAELREYAEYCDVTGVDIYPLGHPTHSSIPNTTLSVVGEEVAKQRAVCDKPVWAVLQGFGWQNVSPRPGGPLRHPTKDELRFMVNDAIGNGATGVVFLGMHEEPVGSPFIEIVLNVAHELSCKGVPCG